MAIDPDELRQLIALGPEQLRTAAAILDDLHRAFPAREGDWTANSLRALADIFEQQRRAAADPSLDEAVIACRSILSLLHYRGLVDTEQNRADVENALTLIHPFSTDAEQRHMRAHDGR